MNSRLIDITDVTSIRRRTEEAPITAIVIDYLDDPIGSGGFATVHKVITIDDQPVTNIVVKIIREEKLQEAPYQSIKLLHQKIDDDESLNGKTVYQEYPELLGLPFMVFRATDSLSGSPVVAMLLHELTALGYEDLGDDGWNVRDFFEAVDDAGRLFLAYQFTRAVAYLHQLKFVHCDLKEQAVFVNKSACTLCLIDFDGGYNCDQQKLPTTIGARTLWAGKKILNALRGKKASEDFNAEERLKEEDYYVASGVFAIIFGYAPFMVLKTYDEASTLEYLKKNKWPSIDKAGDLINPDNVAYHSLMVEMLKIYRSNGLSKLIDAFEHSFNKGYKDENARLSAAEWRDILGSLLKGAALLPVVDHFEADKSFIRKRQEPVSLEWMGRFFKYASIEGRTFLQYDDTHIAHPKDAISITLKLHGYFGDTSETLKVSAQHIDPEIRLFKASVEKRTDLTPVVLSWSTRHAEDVRISNHPQKLFSEGKLEVDPRSKTLYALTAVGNFGQEVTAEVEIDVIEPTVKEFRYEINIDHGIENIDLFWSTENAESVEISPIPGKVPIFGFAHVKIPDRTQFTLTARGHFGTMEKTIDAQPFPLPLIKTLFIPTPDLNVEATVPMTSLKIPKEVLSISGVEIENSISLSSLPDITELTPQLSILLGSIPDTPVTDKLIRKIYHQNSSPKP